MTTPSDITVAAIEGKGRGVVATRQLHRGQILETACCIQLDVSATDAVARTPIDDYYFAHPGDPDGGLLVLGLSSLCNHSDQPNVETTARDSGPTGWIVEMRALCDIEPGSELTRRYNCAPWFTPR